MSKKHKRTKRGKNRRHVSLFTVLVFIQVYCAIVLKQTENSICARDTDASGAMRVTHINRIKKNGC